MEPAAKRPRTYETVDVLQIPGLGDDDDDEVGEIMCDGSDEEFDISDEEFDVDGNVDGDEPQEAISDGDSNEDGHGTEHGDDSGDEQQDGHSTDTVNDDVNSDNELDR